MKGRKEHENEDDCIGLHPGCVLAATVTAMPQGQPSAAPTATDKVVIDGWALSMGTVATGKNQSIPSTSTNGRLRSSASF